MKIVKDIFIKRPMMWQYYLSLFLEIPIVFWFIRNIPQNLFEWVTMVGYIIISLIYYRVNRDDLKYYFVSVTEQSSKEYNPKFGGYFFSSIFICIKFISMGVFLQVLLQSLFRELIIPGTGITIYSLPLFVAMCFILSKILFYLSQLPPVYLLSCIAIPLFIFSLIGIEKALLSWTFISIILSSLVPQFLNEDIKILQKKNFLKIMNNTADNENKEKITRLKYQVLLFIPFFYLALIISEVLIYNDEFNFLYNYLYDRHENILNVSYLSDLNMIATIVKVLVVSFILIVFIEFKDIIIDKLSKFIIIKVLKNEFNVALYGQYNRAFLKNKKWQFDESDYYWCIKNNFQSGNKEVYTYEEGIIKTKSGNYKNIKIVSEDILIIDDTYYVKTTSDVYKSLLQENKSIGFKLLKKPEFSVILFPLILLTISIIGSTLANNIMTNNLRGEYVFADVKDGIINRIDQSKKIEFRNNEILLNKQIYKVDNVTMQILDSNSEVVGSYNKQGILVFKDDSQNISNYILKSSQ
ncbi:hypothetical protein [Streptococcus sp. A22]|uniref:hypothetical protein n=1 Tax=Streptococcus sp. A22 TaxID=3373126 RepID=UPI002004D0F4|nr:hypothetical protein NQZ89_01800 [Streptococcus suis]